MKKISKKTLIAILSVTLALVLVVGATIAYLQDATDVKTNNFVPSTIDVELTETTGDTYKIIPGTSQAKNPKVTYSTPDVPAYVFVEVTDNTNGKVIYSIASDWTQVPDYPNVYYMEVAAGNVNTTGVSVLQGDQVSYAYGLTKEEIAALGNNIHIDFKAYIIQKEPFNAPTPAWEELVTPGSFQPTTTVTNADELATALAMGGTVVLGDDIVVDEPLVVTGNATIDLNGHDIKNTEDLWDKVPGSWSLISVQGGTLTINGNGEVKAKADDCYAADVRDGGHLIINGGTFNGNIHAVYVYNGSLVINGGSFDIQQLYSATQPYDFVINCYDANYNNGTAGYVINGGTFYNFDPSNSHSEPGGTHSFVGDGYTVTESNGWYTVH